MNNFKEGDVVRAKMGGPKMTVELLDDDGVVNTVWFDLNNHIQRDAFHKDALEKGLPE